MPVIVAPKESIDSVNENFFPNVITSKIVRKPDNEKFFTDAYYDETNKSSVKIEMIFDKIAYKFEHSNKKDNKLRSAIRLGENLNNKLDYWYIGIDLLNVERADFDYINGTVTLYSPTAYDITGSK